MENLQGFETWFFGGLITILLASLSFFLKRNLDKMEAKLEKHDIDIGDHETRIQLQEQSGNQIGETLRRTNELLTTLQIYNKSK